MLRLERDERLHALQGLFFLLARFLFLLNLLAQLT